MSVEPTCIFCNASDKSRCRTQGQADGCEAYQRQQKLRVEAKGGVVRGGGFLVGDNISAEFGVDLSGGKRASIASHSGGVPTRYDLYVEQERSENVTLLLTASDLDQLTKILLKMQDYMKPQKGTR